MEPQLESEVIFLFLETSKVFQKVQEEQYKWYGNPKEGQHQVFSSSQTHLLFIL